MNREMQVERLESEKQELKEQQLKAGCCLHSLQRGASPPWKAHVGSTAHVYHTGCIILCKSLNTHPM